jgi:hypothetical protein
MGLSIFHIDKSIDIEDIESKLSSLYKKKKEIEDEIDELEDEKDSSILSSFNVTHNLVPMAKKAGLYDILWHPEEKGILFANQLIEPLEKGIKKLKVNPNEFKQLNAANGWGTYEGFVKFCESVLSSCYKYPNSSIDAEP